MAQTLHPWHCDPVLQGVALTMAVFVGAVVGFQAPYVFSVGTIVILPAVWAATSLLFGIFLEQWALRLAIGFNAAGVAGIVIFNIAEQRSRSWSEIWTVIGIVLFCLVPAILIAYASLIPRLYRVYPIEEEGDETDNDEWWENGEHVSSSTDDN